MRYYGWLIASCLTIGSHHAIIISASTTTNYRLILARTLCPSQSRLPSARRVSVSVLKTERGAREEAKNRHNTILLAFWGQFVDHDIRWGTIKCSITCHTYIIVGVVSPNRITFSIPQRINDAHPPSSQSHPGVHLPREALGVLPGPQHGPQEGDRHGEVHDTAAVRSQSVLNHCPFTIN